MIENAEASAVLMERLHSGEAELDRRFPELRPSLLRVCASLVGEEAEDVVHDTYVRARKTIGQLRDYGAMESWLYRIAVNLCYQRHRRWSRSPQTPLPPDDQPAGAHDDLGLRDLIERLPRRERVILVLHYGHGYRLDEIADLLSINHATVRSVVARTRQRLHRQITEAER